MEWITKELEMSTFRVAHTSDVLRVAILWRFGGTYLDTDMMVLRPFPSISEVPNFISQERHAEGWDGETFSKFLNLYKYKNQEIIANFDVFNILIVNGLLRFQYGNHIIDKFHEHIATHYQGNQWAINGPLAITSVVWDACHVNAYNATGADCFNVTSYESKWFNPVGWQNSAWSFQEELKHKVLEASNGSYTIHFANKMSSKTKLNMDLDTAYKALAQENCPHSVKILI